MTEAQRKNTSSPVDTHLPLIATLILLFAALLRLAALDHIPGGLHFDLAAYLFDATEVIDGARPVFFPRNTGREPFVIYLYALAGAALGPTPFAARLVTVAFGMLSVAAVGFAARQMSRMVWPQAIGRADVAALIAAGTMAGLYWSIHFSRFGLRAAALPALLVLAFGFLLRAMRRDRQQRWWGLPDAARAGLFLGLALESYTAARLAPPAFVLPLLLGLVLERRFAWFSRIAVVGVVSAIVFAPLAWFFWRHPSELSQHALDNSVTNPAINGGDTVAATVYGLYTTAMSFVWEGSPGGAENLPGRPILDPIGAIVFVLGLVIALTWIARLRHHSGAALAGVTIVGWLIWLSLPTALSIPVPGFVRLSGAIGAVPIIVSIGWLVTIDWAERGCARRTVLTVVSGLIALSTLWSARDYFVVWTNDVRYRAAMVDKADATAWLLGRPAGDRLFLAPLWASDFGVQFLARARPLETFDLGQGLVVPTDPAHGVVYAYPYENETSPEEIRALLPGAAQTQVIRDATGRYDLLRVVQFRPTGPPPAVVHRLEDGISFVGSDVRIERTNGLRMFVTVRWLAQSRPTRDYTVFVQLRNVQGTRGQHDGAPVGGGVPTTRWQTGDLIYDRHLVALPADFPTGGYQLYIGMYDAATGRRLRLLDATGQPAPVDEILLGAL